ncbi:unnamed protein product [Hymenolepis diminuta]|uniref:Uncharacterized protein n=1 Tax=Hymenolepis diminuta TaxID=6216 RepID=A0A564YUK0_HYMDI|nr:unnamed protein product [Hymenolepis diminuta]
MADLSSATRIIMLLREFNRSDNYLCSSLFKPMEPADLICEKTIIFELVILRKTNSDVSFSFSVSDLLAMLRFDSDFCPSWAGNPMSRCPVACSNLLQDR